ncbi:MAG: VanW family protein [Clostridia bacterium]|nr:VanW family protein [Clostridia bacterium]
MLKLNRWIALLLALLMLVPAFSLAEDTAAEEAPITHTAKASTTLKVRRAPDDGALGNDSIPRDSLVYIIDYGDLWCKVRTSRVEGYVKTKYLTDVFVVDPDAAAAQADVPPEQALPVGELEPGFSMSKNNFQEKYIAHTVKDRVALYEKPNENAARVCYTNIYEQLVVGEISGDWCFVRYNGTHYGFIRTDYLFKWDRVDPYAGEIPGLTVWPNLAFVNHTTTIYDLQTNKALFTVNPGSALTVGELDSLGRYPLPIDRTTGYIRADEVAYVLPVVNWQEARPGDLISTMTTYFAVGKTTAQIQGRNWNIHLSSDFISGTVLQPGEAYNMNQTIGPYQQATGYKSAPILSPHALVGYGGGTCQVNTTFYVCTIQVPLLVTHRKVHAEVGMDYIPKGFDAAVGGGNINLTMKNTLPYAIRYQFMNSDGVLTCCIFRES